MPDESTRDLITWVLGTVLSLSAVIAAVVKWALLPYLRDKLIRPIEETHRTLTVNGGISEIPTALDKLAVAADAAQRAEAAALEAKRVAEDVDVKLDRHILWHLEESRSRK